jgi:hypothetical protein
MSLADNLRQNSKSSQEGPKAAESGRLRRGSQAMPPAPPRGPTSRATRASELLLPKSGETAT